MDHNKSAQNKTKIEPHLYESKVKKICKLVDSNPNLIFDVRMICQMYNLKYNDALEPIKASTILSRLFRKSMLLRTKTQLKNGYFYSLTNKSELDVLYDHHLLPYDFKNRSNILKILTKNKFETLRANVQFNKHLPRSSDFVKKYGQTYFLNKNMNDFIAMNIGFLMCDGHIKKNLQQVNYFFNQREDAELFKSNFLSVFNKENASLNYSSYCYRVCICNKNLAVLFNSLGIPIGNKVYKPFLVPDWIYNGPDAIKKIFLSTIYGNEGSKPQGNRWRIQFVLCKTKEHVPNLLQFLDQVRTMLNHFGISTSNIQLRKQKRRAFYGRFYIKGKENLINFYNQLGFLYASEKQKVLESLILNEKS